MHPIGIVRSYYPIDIHSGSAVSNRARNTGSQALDRYGNVHKKDNLDANTKSSWNLQCLLIKTE